MATDPQANGEDEEIQTFEEFYEHLRTMTQIQSWGMTQICDGHGHRPTNKSGI